MARPHPHALAGVLTVVALTSSACGNAAISGEQQQQASTAVKIGVILPLTGPVSATGKALQNGFELGVKKVNAAGGVKGRPVEYVVVDDAGNPATSTQLARKLIQQDKVTMMFGTITGDTAVAVSEVVDQEQIPFGTAILGDTENCFPYQWGFGESTRQLLSPTVPELIKKYGPKVAIVGSDYNYPHYYAGIAKEFVAKAGGSVVAEEYSPLGQTDWQPVIKRLAAAKPDVLLSMVVGADAVSFTQQAKQFGLLTPSLGFEGAPLDSDYYPALSALVDGRSHTVRWSEGVQDPDSQAFVADYRKAYQAQGPIPEVAGNAFYGIQFFLAAAEKAADLDGSTLNTEIAKLSFDSPLGKGTHFDASNHVLQADMLEATIKPGGSYEVTRSFGSVPDTSSKPGCA